MKIEIIKKESEPIDDRLSVPVPSNMKLKIDQFKNQNKIDVNEMTRKFWTQLIETVESKNKTA